MPRFWTLQIGGWIAYGISTYLSFLPQVEANRYLSLAQIKTWRTVAGFLISLGLWRIYRRLERASLPPLAIASIAFAVCVFAGPAWLLVYSAGGALIQGRPHSQPLDAAFVRTSLDYAFVLLAWSGLYFGMRSWQRSLHATARAQAAELEMLRYQLNPHFLFNALNSIRALIPAAATPARDMVNEFSELLRYTLHAKPLEPVALRQELDAIRSYLAVERIRFEDKLAAEIASDPAIEHALIPSLLLQPLVENAIKHGRVGARPLHVRIEARREGSGLRIEVANTGSLRGARQESPAGIGLANVRERLALFYGGRATLDVRDDGGWVRAVITIASPGDPEGQPGTIASGGLRVADREA